MAIAFKSILEVFAEGRVDAVTLSKFMSAPESELVSRRLAPSINSLEHYLKYLDALKAIYTQTSGTVTVDGMTIKTVGQIVTDADAATTAAATAANSAVSASSTAITNANNLVQTNIANAIATVNAAIETVAVSKEYIPTDALIKVAPKLGGKSRNQQAVNNDTLSVTDFDSIENAEALALAENKSVNIPAGNFTVSKAADLDLDLYYGEGTIANTTTGDVLKPSVRIHVTPENFGAKAYPFDSTKAFTQAAKFAKDHNLPLVANNPLGYAVNSSVDFYTDTSISKLVMPNNGVYNSLSIKTAQAPDTVAISTLSGLTEFSKKVTGLPAYAVGRYIHIETDQILTERNNAPTNIPYYKNTAFKLLTSAGDISPSLDMSFAATGVTTVKIYKPEQRINFKLGILETVGTGLNYNGIFVSRDAVNVQVGNVVGQTGFRTLFSVAANNTEFHSPIIKDAVFTGLGYGISIGLSCDTLINNMQGTTCRTPLDGRHGANVTVVNSAIEVAGTHWGNNYLFKDCDIKTISWSGKDLTIEGGSLIDGVKMRADASLCIGVLDINGTTLHTDSLAVMPSADQIAAFYTTPRRSFDVVKMRNIECTNDIKYLYGGVSLANFAADHIPPKIFIFENINAPNSNRLNLVYLFLGNSIAFDKAYRFRANNINAKLVAVMIRGFSKYPSVLGYDIRASDCGKFFIQADANTFSKFKLVESTLAGAIRINDSVPNGDILFDDCVIDHDATLATTGLFNIQSRKGFTNCEYRGAFYNGGSVNGAILYSIACRAVTGATGHPVPLGFYVNRLLYQRDDVRFTYAPPTIAANSYIRAEFDVVGAQLGDAVSAGFGVYNAGIEISAQVSLINKVSVLFKNLTSTPVSLSAGTLAISIK